MNKLQIFLAILAALTLSGCSNKLKQKIGLLTPGPNEYQVMRSKSLEIPPHFDLKEIEQRTKTTTSNISSSPAVELNQAELELLKAARGE